MDEKILSELSQESSISTIIEVEEQLFPNNAIQTLPLYYLTLEENQLDLYLMNSFFQKKGSEPVISFTFDELDCIELGISQKMEVVYSLPSENTFLMLKVSLKNTQSLTFECEDLRAVTLLSNYFQQKQIQLFDPLDITSYFQKMKIIMRLF